MKLFNDSNTGLFFIGETCSSGKVFSIWASETSFFIICWVPFEQGVIGELWHFTDKTCELLIGSILYSVSLSNIFADEWDEAFAQNKTLRVGSVGSFFDKQRYDILESIDSVFDVWNKASKSVEGSSTNLNLHKWKCYLFCKAIR